MSQLIKTFIVDSFTDEPFKGNPAGVCVLEKALTETQMLSIAKELGLSETAFILKKAAEKNYTIRFFSPKMEISLCGHATLAAAKVLFEQFPLLKDIQFTTQQQLNLRIKREGLSILMEFPVYDTLPANVPTAMLIALGIKVFKNSVYNEENNILLIEISDSQVLKNLQPDYAALYRSHNSINGVLVTAPSTQSNFDFESRYFWPWSGTTEDPVTGATHTFLAKYWSDKLGKRKMNSFQCSERTGFMEVELIGEDTLIIKSVAQIVLEGLLRL